MCLPEIPVMLVQYLHVDLVVRIVRRQSFGNKLNECERSVDKNMVVVALSDQNARVAPKYQTTKHKALVTLQ